ncbi:MAG: hypothetical protein LBP52_02345 [Burkholderiaceae bacterium]|jgi:hypothetical protein|nr:hypothetical protein [Burkholderiaceae bacterium]
MQGFCCESTKQGYKSRTSLLIAAEKFVWKQRLSTLVPVSSPAPNLDSQISTKICQSLKTGPSGLVLLLAAAGARAAKRGGSLPNQPPPRLGLAPQANPQRLNAMGCWAGSEMVFVISLLRKIRLKIMAQANCKAKA